MTIPRAPTRRAVVSTALAGAALAAARRAAASASARRFEIAGPELRWGDAPVRLVGVAVGDPIYVRKTRTPDDYRVVADVWRANTARVSLHPGHWRANRTAALRALADDVFAARAAGLFVIIDWHVIGFPGRYMSRPDPAWGMPADAYDPDVTLAADFWTEMARSFGRDGGVIFELWNEPVVDPKLWVPTGEHWPLMKSVWLPLIAQIRRHSEAVILVTGGRWATDLKGAARSPIDDARVAYAWHAYPPWDRGQPGRWIDSLDGAHTQRPVVVTEWGFCRTCGDHIRGTPQDFGQPFARQVLERLNLHSTAWCWAAGAAPAMFENDWQTPTEFGRFVRHYLETAKRPAARVPA